MDILKCECCGNNHLVISGEYYKCEYCGAVYKKEHNEFEPRLIRVETFQNPVDILKYQVAIPGEIYNYCDEHERQARIQYEIVNRIAEDIYKYVEIETEFDPVTLMHKTKGKLRIVRPGDHVKFHI